MTRKLPKYVQGWVDHEGRPHHYFRRPGHRRARLPGLPWSPEFMAAYSAMMAESPTPIGIKRSKPGSVGAAVAAYLDSASHFGSRFKSSTKANHRTILERFREQYGELPIGSMPSKFIAAILTKKKPQAARNWVKALRALCKFAIAQGWMQDDPTRGIELPPVKSAGHHTWTDAEIETFEAHHAIGSKPRLALGLLLYTAQRRGDVIRMGPQNITNGKLTFTQQKTDKTLVLDIRPELQAIIEAAVSERKVISIRSAVTFLVRSGKPYRPDDFSHDMRRWCEAAGLPRRCTAHGLRKAACRRMAEAGYSANEIAAWTGHTSLKEVERYTKAADQERMARNALARENAGRTVSVKPPRV
jgi:integrase